MYSFIDALSKHDSLGDSGFAEQRLTPLPGSDARATSSPTSYVRLLPQLHGEPAGAAAEWPLTSSSPAVGPSRKASIGSLLNIPEQPANPILGLPQSPGQAGLSDGGFDLLRQQSPSHAWLRNLEPWAQQQRQQQYAGDVLRRHYRDSHAQQPLHPQQPPSSTHMLQQCQHHSMMPVDAVGVAGMVPFPGVGMVVPSAGLGAAAGSGIAAAGGGSQQLEQEDAGTDNELDAMQLTWQHQHHDTTLQQGRAASQQQGSRSAPGYGSGQQQQQLQQQRQQEEVSKPVAVSTSKKINSKGASSSRKATAAAVAGAVAADAFDFSGLWKPPPQTKEARIPKEPGVEYEDILPQGLDASSTRPLPVPADITQLQDLGGVLSLETWNNVLDEQDRVQLRALLPNRGIGYEDSGGVGGFSIGALLSGEVNFFFGNPTAKFWEDIVSGTAAPRLRRQQETVIQLRQQLAAAQLRNYHNMQVSTLLQMQRLWATQLPADASTAERLALWKAAQHGEVGIPDSPRKVARQVHDEGGEQQDVDDAAAAAANDAGMEAFADATGAQAPIRAAQLPAASATPSGMMFGQQAAAAATAPMQVLPQSHTIQLDGVAVSQPTTILMQPAQLGQRTAAAGVALAVAAAAGANGFRPALQSGPRGFSSGLSTSLCSTSVVQMQAAAQFPVPTRPAPPKQPVPKPVGAKPQAMKAGRQAAASRSYPAIGSRQNLYVYEGPVDFSKNMTKRQAAAAAAAAAKQQVLVGQQQGQEEGQDDVTAD